MPYDVLASSIFPISGMGIMQVPFQEQIPSIPYGFGVAASGIVLSGIALQTPSKAAID